jgi:hypothetical protein
MRTTIFLALFVAAGCASTPATPPAPAAPGAASATAQSQPAASAQTAATKKATGGGGAANKDGKVCRTESVTNTRLKTKKVCLTPEEWMAREEAAKDAFRETAKSPRNPRLDSGG